MAGSLDPTPEQFNQNLWRWGVGIGIIYKTLVTWIAASAEKPWVKL